MRYSLFALVLWLVIPGASAQIRIVVDNANPPFMYASSLGHAQGLYPDLVRAVFHRMNESIEILAVPWKRALLMSEDGDAGIAGLYKNDARLKVYDYSDPIYAEKLLLFVLAGKTFPFHALSDLKGKRLGVIRGWSYGNQFDAARARDLFTAEPGRSDANNFRKLLAGRIDAVVAIEVSGNAALKKMGLQKQILPLRTPVAVNDTYLAFAKSHQDPALLAAFNQALSEMRRDGSFHQIVQSHIDSP